MAEEETIALLVLVQRVLHLPTAAGKAPPADPRRDSDSERETWTPGIISRSSQAPAHAASGKDPRMADHTEGPQLGDHRKACWEHDHQEDNQAVDPLAEDTLVGDQVDR